MPDSPDSGDGSTERGLTGPPHQLAMEPDQTPLPAFTQGAPAQAGTVSPLCQAVTKAAAAASLTSGLGSPAAGRPPLSTSGVRSGASPDPCLNASGALQRAPVRGQADVTLSP